MQAIKKLQDNKIFGEDSIVESVIKKHLWGSPVYKNAYLKVKKTNCLLYTSDAADDMQ